MNKVTEVKVAPNEKIIPEMGMILSKGTDYYQVVLINDYLYLIDFADGNRWSDEPIEDYLELKTSEGWKVVPKGTVLQLTVGN